MSWVLGLAALMILGADEELPMAHDRKVESFTRRIGLSAVPGINATDGVKADWTRLRDAVASEVKGMRLDWQQVRPLEPGLAQIDLSWRRREQQVSVAIFVSGVGPRGAREKLVDLATDTTMTESPLVLGPAGLGDLAVQLVVGQYKNVIWVFRNVCVEVDNEDTGIEILPIARRIQAFMKAHVVPGIDRHVPKVVSVDIVPNPVTVGETLSLKARLAAERRPEEFVIRIREVEEHRLEPLTIDGLTASFRAREPGRTELEIIVVDPKTLLSPRVGVFVDVLPAR